MTEANFVPFRVMTGGGGSAKKSLFRSLALNRSDLRKNESRNVECFQLNQYASLLGDIKPVQDKTVSSLKTSNADDKLFLQQIATINALTEKIGSLEKLPKFIIIRMSLTSLIASHPAAVPDALKLLAGATEGLNEAVAEAYANGAVFAVVSVKDDTLSRAKRAEPSGRSDPLVSVCFFGKLISFSDFLLCF